MNANGPAGQNPDDFRRRLSTPSSFTVCLSLRPHFEQAGTAAGSLPDLVAALLRGGRVDTFHLSHRSPAAGAPGTLEIAREILRLGGVPLVSVALADVDRDEALETVAAYAAAGVRQLVLVTGDYPAGRRADGRAPGFDVDSLQLLMLLSGGAGGINPGTVAGGCVVSPFKTGEAEQVFQYARLLRKADAGAAFVVAQAGFDPRRWDELARFARQQGLDVPLLGTVLVPDAALLRRIREERIPGVSVPETLAGTIAQEHAQPDGGRSAGLRRAAGSLAVLRGVGYRGALLAGAGLDAAAVEFVVDEAAALAGRWRECVEPAAVEQTGFHHFRPGAGELNDDRAAPLAPRRRRHPLYVLSYAIDYVAFGSLEYPFRLMAALCRLCDRSRAGRRALWIAEFLAKRPLYGCRMCGECTLYACGFLCAESGCPKRLINGPCGGSRDGWCEVHPGKKTCVWVRIYGRLKGLEERPDFPVPPIPARDRSYEGTCSWINYCLARDHRHEWVRQRLG